MLLYVCVNAYMCVLDEPDMQDTAGEAEMNS